MERVFVTEFAPNESVIEQFNRYFSRVDHPHKNTREVFLQDCVLQGTQFKSTDIIDSILDMESESIKQRLRDKFQVGHPHKDFSAAWEWLKSSDGIAKFNSAIEDRRALLNAILNPDKIYMLISNPTYDDTFISIMNKMPNVVYTFSIIED